MLWSYTPIAAVYPRVCGGTVAIALMPVLVDGLSPRVRGNLWAIVRGKEVVRSIPACAGEPRAGCSFARPLAVYPRVCGGTAHGAHLLDQSGGSIPACAGEPFFAPHMLIRAAVYPRVCGGTWYW